MATYKFVNADRLDADLQTVADKIREKSQTSNSLAWPSGFIEGIDQCSSLNFAVVGGASKPENPVENTIWVNTETEITSWSISPEQPESPTSGMVWINNGASSESAFNALKKNEIKVYPQTAKQYVGGKWADVESSIYQGGKWSESQKGFVIYENGSFGTNSDGTTFNVADLEKNDGSVSVTKNSDHMLWSNNGALGLFYVEPKVSCAGYKTLNIAIAAANISTVEAYPGKWGLISTLSYSEPGFVASTGFDSLSGDKTLSLDVSSIGSSKYYIAMQFAARSSNSAKITKIWLE